MILGEREGTSVHLLRPEDEGDVLAFERANRAFFAGAVGDRGDAWFATFPERHAALVAENEAGESLLCLVRDRAPGGERVGAIVGRINLGPVVDGDALLGYRIGEVHQGRGHATRAVAIVLAAAPGIGVRRVVAEVAESNPASRKVLEANGFHEMATDGPIAVGLDEKPARRFVCELG